MLTEKLMSDSTLVCLGPCSMMMLTNPHTLLVHTNSLSDTGLLSNAGDGQVGLQVCVNSQIKVYQLEEFPAVLLS